MESKLCRYCKLIKPLSNFNKNKGYKDGYLNKCKSCCKKYYEDRKTHHYALVKNNYENNKERHLEKVKKWQEENREYINEYNKEWRIKNPNYHTEYNKTYSKNNPNYWNEYQKHRRKNDPLFKLSLSTRSLIGNSFKRACDGKYNKSSKTEEILSCSMDGFIEYLKSLFIEGMTLENYGDWELDHIIPLYTAQTEDDIINLNHYTNFQPLWKIDNRKKGKNLDY
jgi:hypothetical protein